MTTPEDIERLIVSVGSEGSPTQRQRFLYQCLALKLSAVRVEQGDRRMKNNLKLGLLSFVSGISGGVVAVLVERLL